MRSQSSYRLALTDGRRLAAGAHGPLSAISTPTVYQRRADGRVPPSGESRRGAAIPARGVASRKAARVSIDPGWNSRSELHSIT